jgi:hypothetical protein
VIPDLGGGLGSFCGNLIVDAGETCELTGSGCATGEICLLCEECISLFPAVPF